MNAPNTKYIQPIPIDTKDNYSLLYHALQPMMLGYFVGLLRIQTAYPFPHDTPTFLMPHPL